MFALFNNRCCDLNQKFSGVMDPRVTVVFILILAYAAISKPLVLSDHFNKYLAGPSLSVLEDKSKAIEIEQILSANEMFEFKPASRLAPNMGFSHSAFWIRMVMQDSSLHNREWVVDLAMPSLHKVDFFVVGDGQIIDRFTTGFLRDKKTCPTPFRNPSIELQTKWGTETTVFARVESQTPVALPLTVRTKDAYIEYDRQRDFFLGFYFGILLIMAVYHLYLFFSTGDRSYLWMMMFTLCFGLGQMSASYGFLRDWGFTNLNKILDLLHIINYFAAFYAVLVSRSMVQSQKFAPRCDLVLKTYLIVTASLALLSPLFSFILAGRILVVLSILPLPLLIYAAIIAHGNDHRPALYYLIAATVFIAGIATYNMMYGFSFIPFNEILFFLPNITLILTLGLFSIGLADRIKTLTREREKARKQSVIHLGEKLKVQKAKSALERELELARKMEAVGRILSGVSHDMNNLIDPIRTYALQIQKECLNIQHLSRHANLLVEAAERLKDLSVNLVKMSLNQPNELTIIDLNSKIDQIASLLKHSVPMGVRLTVKKCDHNPKITADMGMLFSSVLNIGINAVDAMPKGGIVRIETGLAKISANDPMLHKFKISDGTYATVSVIDTGTGISQEELNHIFEPFYTTKASNEGSGLGLANVYSCMKAHGGGIKIQSRPGGPTEVTLFFPLCRRGLSNSQESRIGEIPRRVRPEMPLSDVSGYLTLLEE